ncbi:hypothetical protein RTZ60_000889 [Pseudomonas syringae pv. actinidiae]|nr:MULTISPECIES: hypothetical protein [Pseudomonas syringae group]MDU8584033.1 hypothetical protein [Pseudomonas syringae pv. actinidiae]OSR90214.1 hypothetical protein BV329_00363 [Pseudomonas syringae pv. actinidiae]PYD04404.1 hypothetical protein DND90_09055 [Pseudomonas syringae pv. maculicola]
MSTAVRFGSYAFVGSAETLVIEEGDSSGITFGQARGDTCGSASETNRGDSSGITYHTVLDAPAGFTSVIRKSDSTGITLGPKLGDARCITTGIVQGDSSMATLASAPSAKKPIRPRNGLLLTTPYGRGQSCLAYSISSYKGSAQHG